MLFTTVGSHWSFILTSSACGSCDVTPCSGRI